MSLNINILSNSVFSFAYSGIDVEGNVISTDFAGVDLDGMG